MRKEREEQLDLSQPALIVTYGNTTRKHRLLNRTLTVIGRSSGCDVTLVSPEVAPIHCVIVKVADGWRVRDCTGRGGTRVNGKAIHDELLNDSDTLQIGAFNFQLNLPRGLSAQGLQFAPQVIAPPQSATTKTDDAKIQRLQQSRERLARHALNLRKQLREKQLELTPAPGAASCQDSALFVQSGELEKRAQQLDSLQKELAEQDRNLREEYAEVEHQRKELEKFAREALARKQVELECRAEADLATQREELAAESEKSVAQHRAELEQLAASLEARQRDLEEQLRQAEEINAETAEAREGLRLEFDDVARMRQIAHEDLETHARETTSHLDTLWKQWEAHRLRVEAECGPVVETQNSSAPEHALEIRAREQAHFAEYLKRTQATLTQYEQELSEAYQQFQAEYETAMQAAGTLKAADGTTSADAAEDPSKKDALGVAEEIIAEMRQEAEQLRAELTSQLEEERARTLQADTELKALNREMKALRDHLREREEILEHLKTEVKQLEEQKRPPSLHGEIELASPAKLAELVGHLQKELAARDSRIRDLQQRMETLQQLADPEEKAAYEEELNRYRIELEQNRVQLNEETTRMQVFKAEIEETRHEMELQISRERVQLAREWAEINRVRENIRREAAIGPSSDNARERLANGKQPKLIEPHDTPVSSGAVPAAAAPPDLISRLMRGSRHG